MVPGGTRDLIGFKGGSCIKPYIGERLVYRYMKQREAVVIRPMQVSMNTKKSSQRNSVLFSITY